MSKVIERAAAGIVSQRGWYFVAGAFAAVAGRDAYDGHWSRAAIAAAGTVGAVLAKAIFDRWIDQETAKRIRAVIRGDVS